MTRNFGLDILRAISIWLVLLQHAGINIPGLEPLKIGGIGVEVFFVLSGFLIGGILFREIEKGNNLKETLKSFWIRRWFRILPLYYAVLFFKFIVIDHSISWNILYYVFFLQNNFYGIDFMQVSWSLVIEEWFYIISPIFLFFSIKLLRSDRQVFLSIIGFILGIILLRMFYVLHGNVSYQGVNGNFPFRFDSLFLGVLLSFIKHKKWKLFDFLCSKVIFITALILFIVYIYIFRTWSYPDNLINQLYFPRTIGFFILPFTISLMIPFASTIKIDLNKHFINRLFGEFITKTSILTYAIYLIHPFIFPGILENPSIESPINRIIIAVSVTYLVSWIVYRFFEKPILVFRDKMTIRNKPGRDSRVY